LNTNDVNRESTDFDVNIADFFKMLSDSQMESLVTDVDNTSSSLSDGNNNVALRQDSATLCQILVSRHMHTHLCLWFPTTMEQLTLIFHIIRNSLLLLRKNN
jgi:hypothetical protein